MVSFRKLRPSDIANLQSRYKDEFLYKIIDSVCLPWEEKMPHIMLSPEEIFWYTVVCIDYIREKQGDSKETIEKWAMRWWNDLRRTYPEADDEECRLAVTLPIKTLAGCLFVTQHPLYERFGGVLIRSLNETKKHTEAYKTLDEGYRPYEEKIADWLAKYMVSDQWLSDEIAEILAANQTNSEGHFAYLMDGLSEEAAKAFDKELHEVCTGSATGVIEFIQKDFHIRINKDRWDRASIKERYQELKRFGLDKTFDTLAKAVRKSMKVRNSKK